MRQRISRLKFSEISTAYSVGVHITLRNITESITHFFISYQTIREDGLQQNSLNVGTYLLTELSKLRNKYEIIGDVRGKGLQIGVEMVKDKVLNL